MELGNNDVILLLALSPTPLKTPVLWGKYISDGDKQAEDDEPGFADLFDEDDVNDDRFLQEQQRTDPSSNVGEEEYFFNVDFE